MKKGGVDKTKQRKKDAQKRWALILFQTILGRVPVDVSGDASVSSSLSPLAAASSKNLRIEAQRRRDEVFADEGILHTADPEAHASMSMRTQIKTVTT